MDGFSVNLGRLMDNSETVHAVRGAFGRTIESIAVRDKQEGVSRWDNEGIDTLVVTFEDGTVLNLWDAGQSCCERRYMNTDDDLAYYKGAVLSDVEVAAGTDTPEDEWGGEHQIQFLRLLTDRGVITVANHNEHNGYYGGFHLVANGTTARNEVAQ